MADSPQLILDQLKNKKYQPVYFLYGDEPYYIDTIISYVENHILSPEERSFNQVVVYGKEITVSTLLAHAKKFPMLGEKQVVIVKEAQEIADLSKTESEKWLISYLQNPLESTFLILGYKYKKPTKKLLDIFQKHSICVESKKIYDDKLPAWISQLVASKGSKIDTQAALLLAEFIGNDLQRLDNEIEKIFLNMSKTEKLITTEYIYKYVGISKEYNVFELQKALNGKDIFKANQIIQYFNNNPKDNPAVVIIAFLFTYFSKLLILHQLKDKSEKNIASALKIHPFFAKEYVIGYQNYSLQKVMDIVHYLREADLQSKGIEGTQEESAILKELIFKILHS